MNRTLLRREFALVLAGLAAGTGKTLSQTESKRMQTRRTSIGGRVLCASCEGVTPTSAEMTIAGANEPGERMEIRGVVYHADGQTPYAGMTVFAYHTDAAGHYSAQDDPFAPRLRGWLKTGADGAYVLRSIKPAAYPKHTEPAHIHVHVYAAGYEERFLDDYWFEGDALIPAAALARWAVAGRWSPIVRLTRGADGVWRGVRDLRLSEP